VLQFAPIEGMVQVRCVPAELLISRGDPSILARSDYLALGRVQMTDASHLLFPGTGLLRPRSRHVESKYSFPPAVTWYARNVSFRITGISNLDLFGVLKSAKETCPPIYEHLKYLCGFSNRQYIVMEVC
jgi:hypothetical protein